MEAIETQDLKGTVATVASVAMVSYCYKFI